MLDAGCAGGSVARRAGPLDPAVVIDVHGAGAVQRHRGVAGENGVRVQSGAGEVQDARHCFAATRTAASVEFGNFTVAVSPRRYAVMSLIGTYLTTILA